MTAPPIGPVALTGGAPRRAEAAGDDRYQAFVCTTQGMILEARGLVPARDPGVERRPPGRRTHGDSSFLGSRRSACVGAEEDRGCRRAPRIGRSRAAGMTESGISDGFATLWVARSLRLPAHADASCGAETRLACRGIRRVDPRAKPGFCSSGCAFLRGRRIPRSAPPSVHSLRGDFRTPSWARRESASPDWLPESAPATGMMADGSGFPGAHDTD